MHPISQLAQGRATTRPFNPEMRDVARFVGDAWPGASAARLARDDRGVGGAAGELWTGRMRTGWRRCSRGWGSGSSGTCGTESAGSRNGWRMRGSGMGSCCREGRGACARLNRAESRSSLHRNQLCRVGGLVVILCAAQKAPPFSVNRCARPDLSQQPLKLGPPAADADDHGIGRSSLVCHGLTGTIGQVLAVPCYRATQYT